MLPSFLDRGPARISRVNAPLARALLLSLLAVTVVLGGCATTSAARDGGAADGEATAEERPAKNQDPLEGFNRGVFKFNDAVDRAALRPAAVAYRDHTPSWLQKGVGNFFTNLFYPTTIANQFLQGKFKQGGQDIARFVINTTLGWGGLFDVASGARLPIHDEDSGQTLGRWGVPAGPYLMLPFLGPATLRDAPARIADDFTQPFRWYDAGNERYFSLVVYLVDKRASLLQLDRLVKEAYDPYAFVRDAYLQRREYAVRDGDVPQEELEDDSDWAEEALREDEAAAAEESEQ
jgi:phospholipid-binding lipoprotein MlaA